VGVALGVAVDGMGVAGSGGAGGDVAIHAVGSPTPPATLVVACDVELAASGTSARGEQRAIMERISRIKRASSSRPIDVIDYRSEPSRRAPDSLSQTRPMMRTRFSTRHLS